MRDRICRNIVSISWTMRIGLIIGDEDLCTDWGSSVVHSCLNALAYVVYQPLVQVDRHCHPCQRRNVAHSQASIFDNDSSM